MPAETSIGLSQDVKDRLEQRRTSGHASMAEVIEGLLEIVPPADDILDDEACSWPGCDEPLWVPDRPEDRGGVIRWFAHEVDGSMVHGSAYYCSPEHAMKAAEEEAEMAAAEPDKLTLGGMDEMRQEVPGGDIRLFHEGAHGDGQRRKEIGIGHALDLVGEDRHGNEYDYHGEPVYVWNEGRVRFSGVIDEIIREETHTALYMGRDRATAMLHHPDEERRGEFLRNYCHWYDQECPECGKLLRVSEAMKDEIECSECGEMIERAPVPEEDIPDDVLEYRELDSAEWDADGSGNADDFTVEE